MGEQSPLRGQSSLPGASSLQAALSAQGASPLQPSALPSSRGSGPRIYVGGIPTAVSETMIRQHFSQWGQVSGSHPLMSCYEMIRQRFRQWGPDQEGQAMSHPLRTLLCSAIRC